MTGKFIARSIKGQEFMFSTASMIAVPESSASKIADALNRIGYELKAGETWHVHNNDGYYNSMIDREIKRYGKRMPVYKYYG